MPTLTAPAALLLGALPEFGHTFGSIALAILGIGGLIMLHELGHFLACRLTKTRVETFSIGFGPRLFGWESSGGVRRLTVGARRSSAAEGALDVRISAIPLGGYVKMAGEIGGDGGPGSGVAARAPRPDEFPAKPFLSRVFIISAGVLMNVLTALVLFTIAYASGIEEVPPIVGDVVPGEPAWAADLRPGDRIETYGGAKVRSFGEFRQEVLFSSSSGAPAVHVSRDGKPVDLVLKPRYDEEAGIQQAGVAPAASWTVGEGAGAFTIGPADRVTIDGRPATGGRAAASAAWEAWALGRREVKIVVLDVIHSVDGSTDPGSWRRGPVEHVVALPSAPKESKPGGDAKLGVVPASNLLVEAVRTGSPAEASGLRAGDRLVATDGVALAGAAALAYLPSLARVDVLHEGKQASLEVDAKDPAAVAAFVDGIAFSSKPAPKAPAAVLPDGESFADGKSPAAEAGVRPGEEVVEIAGKPVASWDDLMERVKGLKTEPVPVKVRGADGAVREVSVTPKVPADLAKVQEFFFGATRLVMPKETVGASGLADAVGLAGKRAWTEIRNIFRMIGRFAGGEISPGKNLGGPGTIVNLSSRTAQDGLAAFLAFLAFISINLAVLNILPIPVLDGGSLLLLIVEKLRGGRPLKEATIAYLQWAGFALLMLLMVFAIKNDIGNLSH